MKAQRIRKVLWLTNAALVAGVLAVGALLVLNKPAEAKAAPEWATKALTAYKDKTPVQRLKPAVEKSEIEDVFLKPDWKELPYFPFVGPKIPPPRPKEAAVVEQPKGPTGLEAIGRVRMLMYRPPARPGEPASGSAIGWEFSGGETKTGVFGPGDFIVLGDQRKRFKLVDVLQPDRKVARWVLVYDVYDDPQGSPVSRGELVHDNEPKENADILRRPGGPTKPAAGAPGAAPGASVSEPAGVKPPASGSGVVVVGRETPKVPSGSSSASDWRAEVRETGPGRRAVTFDDATFERFKGQDIEKILENVRTDEYEGPGVKGLRITPVGDTSIADKLTLMRGDILVSIDGRPTPNRDAAVRAARAVSPDAARVSVEIDRNGQRLTYDVDPRDPKTRRAAAVAAGR